MPRIRLALWGTHLALPTRLLALSLLCGAVSACSGSTTVDTTTIGPGVAISDKHRGIAYEHAWGRRAAAEGYGSEASGRSLAHLAELGVNWITLTPFGFQRDPRAATFRWRGGPRRRGGATVETARDAQTERTDTQLRLVTAQAREHDIRVMLKPHVWLRPPAWVGMVEPGTEADWVQWFDTYRAFILHYAQLAQDVGIDGFCIGNELTRTTHREAEWRQLISEIREVYSGFLTYGAHADEVEDLPFWDALDAIGVSAYFPVADTRAPSRTDMATAWARIASRLARLSARHGRPVLFTELGYRSVDFAARYPWKFDDTPPINLQLQADAYTAFFDAVWGEPWFLGVYWWKWRSSLDDGGPKNDDYTPRGKPAEEVLRHHFTGAAAKPPQW